MGDKKLLVIMGGGVAAHKLVEYLRVLHQEEQIRTRIILTKAAERFVTPLSVASLTECEDIRADLFELRHEIGSQRDHDSTNLSSMESSSSVEGSSSMGSLSSMGHIALARWSHAILVAPATADLMARAAHGLADGLATSCLLAAEVPILYMPSMNHRMWSHPATQHNLSLLRARGALVIDPVEGAMACGEHGVGRLASLESLRASLAGLSAWSSEDSTRQGLCGRRVLVVAGATREPLDEVRYVTNRSSGRQGFALATALSSLGAEVELIVGHSSVEPPLGMVVARVSTADSMHAATMARIEGALSAYDVVVMAAAVSDWQSARAPRGKIKKTAEKNLRLEFTPTPDILRAVSTHATRRPLLVVGFALEAEKEDAKLIANAKQKLKQKGCDWIIANRASESLESTENRAWLLTAHGGDKDALGDTIEWSRRSKQSLASAIAAEIARFFRARGA